MGLGLNVAGGEGGSVGDRIPYIKYNAKAGRMYLVDREQGGDGMWASSEREVSPGFAGIFDMPNIQVGWINYTKDQGPLRALVPLGKPMGVRPVAMVTTDAGTQRNAYKPGFNVHIVMSKAEGGIVREMNANAACVVEAMDALHNAYLDGVSKNPGKLPVVKFAGVVKEKAGKSENFKPLFEITGWVERPAVLDTVQAVTQAAPEQSFGSTPPSTGATLVAPPAKQLADADAEF